MKTCFIWCVLVIVCLCLSACRDDTVEGSGTLKTEVREIEAVTRVSMRAGGMLELRPGPPSISVSADDNLLPYLETILDEGTLVIRTTKDQSIRPVQPITYSVSLPEVNSLSVIGTGTLHAAQLSPEQLTAAVIGSGRLELSGLQATALSSSIIGAGTLLASGEVFLHSVSIDDKPEEGSARYNAQALRGEQVSIEAKGTPVLIVCALKSLDSHINGPVQITYYGDPEIQDERVRPELGTLSRAGEC